MTDKVFVDTNILLYAHDSAAGEKHDLARRLLNELWEARTGVLSTQVLQELYVNLRRKLQIPLNADEARKFIVDYSAWDVIVNDSASVIEAIDIAGRYRLSFWDALIIQAACIADAAIIYSEDMHDGQHYGPVQVIDPLLIA